MTGNATATKARAKRDTSPRKLPEQLDVLIVGAGFAGLYLLHRMRELGVSARIVEAADGVGGTWYWNRYPGARCDVESMQYSYSVFEDLQQEWRWSELYAGQPEILRYANHVADRHDLRREIHLATRVDSAHYSEANGWWAVSVDTGQTVRARFVVMATGCLSTAQLPGFEALDTFEGSTYHTGHWPHDPVDFSDQRVGVIGTGSSAIQCIPIIAEQARHLTVFQRTPNYSIPARNRAMPETHESAWKGDYATLREAARWTRNGLVLQREEAGAMEVTRVERERIYTARWETGGFGYMAAFGDLLTDAEANETAAEFVRERIRETVEDPILAELLAPKDYPIGTKRICVDTDYFETFNRANVELVDLKTAPIRRFTRHGLIAGEGEYAFDSVVFATGFDAMTGTLARIDIRGRGGERLVDKWAAGPRTFLGLTTAGFPNLFLITGPGSPSVLSNMMVSIEQHVDWVCDLLETMAEQGHTTVEATRGAEDAWVEHVNEVAYKTLYPRAASWYMGANVPGKPRLFLPYIGGVGVYREKCNAVAASGYEGFTFESATDRLG